MFFLRDLSLFLIGFSDADWIGYIENIRSTINQCFIFWKASHFIGYIEITNYFQILMRNWISCIDCNNLWASRACIFTWRYEDSTTKIRVIYYDNVSFIHIAANHMFYKRTKHFKIDCYLVWEKLQSGLLKLMFISSIDQNAYIFTKPLLRQPFHLFLFKWGMVNIYSPTCEEINIIRKKKKLQVSYPNN